LNIPTSLVFYIGDDFSDEDVFLAYPDGITIRVGQCPETSARYQLEDQLEVRSFLEWLDTFLRQKTGHEPACAIRQKRQLSKRLLVLLVLVAAKPPGAALVTTTEQSCHVAERPTLGTRMPSFTKSRYAAFSIATAMAPATCAA